jgi:hypothetical protein
MPRTLVCQTSVRGSVVLCIDSFVAIGPSAAATRTRFRTTFGNHKALPIEWNPDSESRNATVYWSKTVYDTSVNRTFAIRGNMTEDGAVGQ